MEKNRFGFRENTLLIETLIPDFGNIVRDQEYIPGYQNRRVVAKKKKKSTFKYYH